MMTEVCEYLVSYGNAGDFGRFRPTRALTCQRGDRVVVRTYRGLELGEVLCLASPGHARFLPNTTVGALLRPASTKDEETALAYRSKGQQVIEEGRRLASELRLPLEILDADVLLDDENAVVHYLRWEECDFRPLVSALSRKFAVQVTMHDLALPKPAEDEEDHGCGRTDCGRVGGGGGCSSCSSGGCSTCGSAQPEDVAAHFANLRAQMEARNRTPLL